MTRYAWAGASIALAFALTGCGGSDTTKTSTPTTTAAAAATTPAAAPTSAHGAVHNPDAYLAALKQINPGLVANRDRALNRAADTCLDIQQGEFTGQKLNARVAERMSGGDATITESQAAAVVVLVRKYLC